MSEVSVLGGPEYAPKIRNHLDLRDLSLRTESGPFAPTDFDKLKPECLNIQMKSCMDNASSRTEIRLRFPPQLYLTNEPPFRQKLVDPEELRERLITLAQNHSQFLSSRTIEENPRRPKNRLSTSPLVEALSQAVERKRAAAELSSKFGEPPVISFPVTPLKPPQEDKVEERASSPPSAKSSNPEELQSNNSVSETVIRQDSPITLVTLSDTKSESSRSPMVQSRNITSVFRICDTVRLVRIVEKIAARKILRAWRKRRKATEKYRVEIKQMKSFMKEVVVSALKANKQIRDELRGIRGQMVDDTARKLSSTSPTRDIITNLASKEPPFKSARLLLDSSVKSPIMIDMLINDLTLGENRNSVRFCVGQPTLHPKALVVVLLIESVSRDEWLARIAKSSPVFAYDRAFPLTQGAATGVPWEVLIRRDMSEIHPDWVEFSGRNVVYNSLS